MAIPSEALKPCSKCGSEKPIAEYYIRKNGKPHAHCKTCYKANVKARRYGPDRARVIELENRWSRQWRRQLRDRVFAAYGGYRCACCGETQPEFLSLDHIANDGAEFRRRVLGGRTKAGVPTYQWLLRNGFPPGVQVMCMNCQHGKRMNGGICPHQRTCNDYPAREYGQAAGSAAPLSKAG